MPFVFAILPLCSIVYQDFKQRAISWYWPVLLLLSSFYCGWLTSGKEMFFNAVMNLFFLLVVLLCVTLYFSLKSKKLISVFDVFVGWGDVLFLVALVPLFHPLDYVLFYTLSTIVSLFVALVMKGKEIPFAGILSALLLFVFVAGWLSDTMWLMHFQFKTLLF